MTGYQSESSERQNLLRRKAADPAGPDTHSPDHPLLTLQSQIGNANVARLLAQRDADEDKEAMAKHDRSLQRAADDDKEMMAKHDRSLQREADDDKEMMAKHDLAQREEDTERVGVEGGAVGPETAQRISAARGGGSGLDSGLQSQMESGFGTSFADVRVHQDAESNTLTRRLTSHAFTTGSDIFLRNDASPSDSRLLAHELTHVVQQRDMSGGGSMTVGSAGDAHEAHADAMASSILSGGSAPAAAAPSAQREADDDKDAMAKPDLSLQRDADEDKEAMALHDPSLQRASDEDDNV